MALSEGPRFLTVDDARPLFLEMYRAERRPIVLRIAAALVLLIVLECVGLALALGLINKNHETIANQQAQQLHSCQRGNESRHALIRFVEATKDGNRHRANAWADVPPLPGSFTLFTHEQRQANIGELDLLRSVERTMVQAQRPVARHPDGKGPIRRSTVACRATFS